MGVLMIALTSFKGQEGMIKSGDIFEVNRKNRAEDLAASKLAKFHEEEEKEQGNENDEQPHSLEDILKGLNSHAKVDEFVKTNELIDIPGKEEAKLEERKTAINDLITNNSHRENAKQ